MAREARVVAAGVPRHVTQRGWADILHRGVEADELRAATYAGLPYGEPDFIEPWNSRPSGRFGGADRDPSPKPEREAPE